MDKVERLSFGITGIVCGFVFLAIIVSSFRQGAGIHDNCL